MSEASLDGVVDRVPDFKAHIDEGKEPEPAMERHNFSERNQAASYSTEGFSGNQTFD